jgi:hypothetical protein
MLDNPTTENAPLDAEDWQIAFEPYAQNPVLALVLAQHLSALQDHVQTDAGKATAAINRAIDELYQHSEFRSVSLELFRSTVQGTLAVELEKLVNQLGIRT